MLAAGAGLAAGAYAAYVVSAWFGYGKPALPANADDCDVLLDHFLPVYDVVERHRIDVAAPPAVTLAAASELDLMGTGVTRTIVRAREILLRAKPDARERPHGLLAEVQAMGWGVLATVPDREIVVGAVTKPWEASPVFRPIPPDSFGAFEEPDYVKIIWTLRADPAGDGRSVFRTETRAVATDAGARAKFRRYWAFLSPGIILIRWSALGPLKAEAERRHRQQ